MDAPVARTRVRRLPELQVDDVAVLHSILDEGKVAQLAIVHDGQPYAIPVAYGQVRLLRAVSPSRRRARADPWTGVAPV